MASQLSLQNRSLLQELLQLDPLEQLGKTMYLGRPSRILQPITNRAQLGAVQRLIQAYGIPVDAPGGISGLYNMLFTPSMKEQDSIHGHYDIAVGLHPRYIGNAPHTHDFFELNYVCSGHMTQTIAAQSMELQPGDLVLLCPGVSHDVLSLDDGNIMLTIRLRKSSFYRTFFSLFTEDDIFYRYFQGILFHDQSAPYLLFRTGDDEMLMSHFLQMYQESNHPREYSRQYLNLLMSEVFLKLLRDHCGQLYVGSADTRDSAPMALILHYISANCQTVTLAAVAQQFHYNTSYLSRLLKDSLGKNFLEIRAELRLDRAKTLLESSDYSSAQIAAMVGYQNLSHFHKAFKAYTGSTPGEYRSKSVT